MERNYFELCYKHNTKVRWICKALKVTHFLELEQIRSMVNEKLTRIEKRKGRLDELAISRICENLILAKIAKKYIEKRTKPYRAKVLKSSPTHEFIRRFPKAEFDFESSHCAIFKEKHYRLGSNPSILFPGFLPDGNEAFFLLRKCFLKFGSVYYLNYPTTHFYKETIFHQIYDTIVQINNRKIHNAGKKSSPFLVGTSFGCHMIVSFLNWLQKNELVDNIEFSGIVLISPVLCLEDLVDPKLRKQRSLVGRAVSLLVQADELDAEATSKAMQRAKSIFAKMFTSGRDLMKFDSRDQIPIFAIEDEVLSVFSKEVKEDDGYFYRFLELKQEEPIQNRFLSNMPALVLFAEGEEDVLTLDSPTLKMFRDINQLRTVFPNGTVEFVYSKNENRRVTHSDLVFQAGRFIEHLDAWLSRIAL